MTSVCYDTLARQTEALFTGEDNLIAAMANFSALLNENLENLNWVGFYLVDGEQLILGPFQGKVACSRIPMGKGVCSHRITTVDALRRRHPNAKFVLCGDFNELDTSDITSHLCLTQTVEFPTYDHNTLDLILTDLTVWHLPSRPLPSIGRSNHTSVLWSPSPTISHQREAEIKNPSPYTRLGDQKVWGLVGALPLG